MSANRIEGQCLIERLAGFSPVRAIGTMATATLFAIASTFLLGCGQEIPVVKAPPKVEAPIKAAPAVAPFLCVHEPEDADDYGVWAQKNEKGKYILCMTKPAYGQLAESFGGGDNCSGVDAAEMHRATDVFRRLDDVCRFLAAKPSAEIEPETRQDDFFNSRFSMIAGAFRKARADAMRAARMQQSPASATTYFPFPR